jgi:hypothetical protein
VAANPALQARRPYFDPPFVIARLGFYFLVWIVLAVLFSRWARKADGADGARWAGRLTGLGAAGLILYALTGTFFSIDVVMSLEPEWDSTIFGAIVLAGQVLSALSFAVVVTVFVTARAPAEGQVQPKHLHDLGNLLLAFLMLWMYMAFSQYLIIWAGNLPEETTWFYHRQNSDWKWVALVLVGCHFFVPFFVLLFREVKRRALTLGILVAVLLVLRWVDLLWLTRPAFEEHAVRLYWLDLAAMIGIGGVWLAAFCALLKTRPLLEPYLKQEEA